jgi:hypothetical protein
LPHQAETKTMKPPLPRTLSAVPQLLHVQVEIGKAVHVLFDQPAQALPRAENAAVSIWDEEIGRELREACRQWLLMRSRSRAVSAKATKAAVDDPVHPGWPARTPDGKGGQFRPKDGQTVIAGGQYFPPPPPGYNPNTWKQGQWPNGTHWLEDPNGRRFTVHPEDDFHWRHWDTDDGDRWPPNSKKPWPTQKRQPESDQSLSDPNGDAPPWTPDPFIPIIPEPILPIEPIPVFPTAPVLIPG